MEISELLRQTQREAVQFMEDELVVASTFLDVANTALHTQTRERHIGHARRACDTVTRLLAERVQCSPAQRDDILRELAKLEKRISEATRV